MSNPFLFRFVLSTVPNRSESGGTFSSELGLFIFLAVSLGLKVLSSFFALEHDVKVRIGVAMIRWEGFDGMNSDVVQGQWPGNCCCCLVQKDGCDTLLEVVFDLYCPRPFLRIVRPRPLNGVYHGLNRRILAINHGGRKGAPFPTTGFVDGLRDGF